MDLEETSRRSLYTSYRDNKCSLLTKDEYIKTFGELLEATHEPKKSPRQYTCLRNKTFCSVGCSNAYQKEAKPGTSTVFRYHRGYLSHHQARPRPLLVMEDETR